ATDYSISVSLTQNADNFFLVTATNTTNSNQSAETAVPTITEDSIAPLAPSTPTLDPASESGSSNTDNITDDNTPTFDGTAEPHSTVIIYSDGVAVGSDSADSSGNYSVITTVLTDGTHSIPGKAMDAAGNISPASGTLSITIDTQPPVAPSTPQE